MNLTESVQVRSTNVNGSTEENEGIQRVKIMERETAIGFSGNVKGGMISRNRDRVYYPLGFTIVVRHLNDQSPIQKQTFLRGHNHRITCMSLSATGRFLVSGESHAVGTKVQMIIWDGVKLEMSGGHNLHHAGIVSVEVSPNEKYVCSVGGQEDSKLVIYDLEQNLPLCVGKKTYGRPFVPTCMTFHPRQDDILFTGGQDCLQIWTFDAQNHKLTFKDVSMGKLKRNASVLMTLDNEDSGGQNILLMGTESGDIVKLVLTLTHELELHLAVVSCAIKGIRNKKLDVTAGKFSGGVNCILQVKYDEFLIGSGDGKVCLVRDQSLTKKSKPISSRRAKEYSLKIVPEPTSACLKELRSVTYQGSVTSLCLLERGLVLVGCASGEIHQLETLTFESSLLSTCHTGNINFLQFPQHIDRIIGSCGDDGVRLWDIYSGHQIFHIPDPATCALTMAVSPDGRAIYAGFSDGAVRCFTPQTGRYLFGTPGVHPGGVVALCILSSRDKMISGGIDGQIRTWILGDRTGKPKLVMTIQEHSQRITSLELTKDEKEVLSASRDGSCIIWSLAKDLQLKRKRILNCSFSLISAKFHPTECQILTLTEDGQLGYWEVLNGEEIRNIQVEKHGFAKCLAISDNGEHFAVGSKDSTIKLWRYRQGNLCQLARANCGEVTSVLLTGSTSHLVASTKMGGILTWRVNK